MKIKNFIGFIVIAVSVLIFFACEDKINSGNNNYAIVSISPYGSAGTPTDIPTTKLIITVNDDKLALVSDDIKINANFSVIKGKLTQINTMTYELLITPGGSGTIRVGLNPYRGFTGWNAKIAYVYTDWNFSIITDETITLTITGCDRADSSLTIPSKLPETYGFPITAIGYRAFYNESLLNIIIPDSINDIGDSAFAYNRLSEINIPNSVVFIGSTSFALNNLSKVIIPDSVIDIGYGAFAYNQLNSAVISSKVTSIKNSTFAYNQLTNVTIPKGVYSIGDDAFAYNKLKEINIPESVAVIGNGAFAYNQLEEDVKIPNNLISLSGFNNNLIKKTIIIPETVTSIGSSAFSYNQLTEINIPDNVLIIGSNAFSNNKLTHVSFSSKISSIGYRTFADNNISEITILENIKNIDVNAFINNPLTSITIGANVTLGSSAFGNGFEHAYNINNRAAGKYTRPNTSSSNWTYSPL